MARVKVMKPNAPAAGMSSAIAAAASGPCNARSAPSSARDQAAVAPGRRRDRREVAVLGPGVDDDIEPALILRLGGTPDHQVVDHTARRIEQQGVSGFAPV